ncbi:MAG: lysophospholipid acyltransferase family protein [Actinomycetota bacterium]|nr:lysophospholipid acyltransferase family protein [Actinomycetota bacterium]
MTDIVYPPIVFTAKTLFKVLGIRFDIVGSEYLPRVGGAVIAINHTSYLDFALSGIPADRVGHRLVRFMAKDGIFKHPIAGPLMRGMHHIPVDRNAGSQAFRDAVRALKDGELVGVFPEATMSRSMEIKEIKSGAMRMAAAAQVPLLPMIVFGGARILSYGRKDLTRGRTVAMTIGAPMHPTRRDDAEVANEQLHQQLQQLLDATIDRYPKPTPKELAATDGPWWLPARRGGTAPTLTEAEAIETRVRAERAARKAPVEKEEQPSEGS